MSKSFLLPLASLLNQMYHPPFFHPPSQCCKMTICVIMTYLCCNLLIQPRAARCLFQELPDRRRRPPPSPLRRLTTILHVITSITMPAPMLGRHPMMGRGHHPLHGRPATAPRLQLRLLRRLPRRQHLLHHRHLQLSILC
jgi:hypothetical protein